MAKWYDLKVLNEGLTIIDTDANQLHLLKAYTAGDNYTTVTTTNTLGNVTLAAGDITLGNQGTNGRQAIVAQKTITGAIASGGTPDLHVALVDTVNSLVLAVTDETSDQEIFSGNDVTVPTFNCKMNQPT
jgi:hypothetical protein